MKKYGPHSYDARIPPATLHDMIAALKKEVNGLLSDSNVDKREIYLLRDSLGRKL